MRVLLRGPYESDGRVLRRVGDPVSAQVVATFTVAGATASGGGLLLGHACPPNDQRTFCHLAAPVQLSFTTGTRAGRVLEGAFSVTLDAGEQAWSLVLYYADRLYLEPATLESVEGSYVEQFSEVAPGEQMVATVDANGRLFFQSAVSGCVGNGALAPHLGGAYNVYDISLTIENCGAEYGSLERCLRRARDAQRLPEQFLLHVSIPITVTGFCLAIDTPGSATPGRHGVVGSSAVIAIPAPAAPPLYSLMLGLASIAASGCDGDQIGEPVALTGLEVTGAKTSLTPPFDPTVYRYSVVADDSPDDVTFTPSAALPVVISVDGAITPSDTPRSVATLAAGDVITIEVQARSRNAPKPTVYEIVYLPPDFPQLIVTTLTPEASPEPLYVNLNGPRSFYVAILDNHGVPLFYRAGR